MIRIIGDTPDELEELQDIMDVGILNNSDSKISLDVCYELSSGDNLLFSKYNHIIGCIPLDDIIEDRRKRKAEVKSNE